MKFYELKTKKERVSFIREKLAISPQWAVRGMVKIFEYQTESEKISELTKEQNGVGFNGVDAEILSSFVKQVSKGRTLSPKQLSIVYKKMPKYAGQLESISEKSA